MADDDDDDDVLAPKTPEQWAMLTAIKIERDHGDQGPVYIAEMIGKFALEGNQRYIDMWKAVARAYDQLMRPAVGIN